MQKIISARFPGKCKTCGGGIAAGERVYWLGKGSLRHMSCPNSKPDAPVKSDDSTAENFAIPFAELRKGWAKVSSGDYSDFTKNRKIAEYLHNEIWLGDSRWVGATIPEMNSWLSEGFRVEGLQGVDPSLFPAKPRRKLRFAEEGDELMIDLAWSGVDEHFIEWEKRVQKPGLTVEIACTFHSGYSAEIIVNYQRWIARMLQSLDEAAIDSQVAITNRVTGAHSGDYSTVSNTRVIVKESGQASDISAWSAMFSPGGFRQLMFCAKLYGAEHLGKLLDKGLGAPKPEKEWTVSYDSEANTLYVANAQNTTEFPEFDMTEKFRAVLETISGG